VTDAAMAALIIGLFLVALATGIPIAFVLFGLPALIILILFEPQQLVVLYLSYWKIATTDIFIAAPLFILMAAVLETSGIARALFDMMYKWFAGFRGGLAIGTVVICTLIAAMTGIGATGVVMMGMLAYPEMRRRGYNKSIALGCIPSGGALGPLIPPSVIMIIVAAFGQLSVGKMFIGGVLPGLLMSFLFIVYIAIRCYRNPHMAPALPLEERATWGEKFISLRGVILPIMLVILVLGSIYSGIATPTEAAGVGAFGAFICAAINRQLNWQNTKNAALRTLQTTSMVLWLVIGGQAFATLLGMTGVRHFIAESLLGAQLAPIMLIIIMMVIGLILGMFMDASAIIIICIPIFMPVVLALGFDPLWFAILFTINVIIGYISPPFGANLFFTKAIVPPDVTMGDIYRSVIPYNLLMVIVLIVSILWPPLLLWLPNTMIK